MTLDEEIAALRAENEALRTENEVLRTQVGILEEELKEAQERIAELERGKKGPPLWVKANKRRDRGPRAARRKRAAEKNHGRKRETPTKVVVHALEHCPTCGGQLSGQSLAWRRQVIDLPPPQAAEVTEHRVLKRWCPQCKRWHMPRLDLRGQVLGQGRLGVHLVSVIAYLRTRLRLPYRLIQEYLRTMHRVELSVGELVEVLARMQQAVAPALQSLREQMQDSAILHMDETGWREGGRNGYLWVGSTPGAEGVRYYEYAASRSREVVRRFLGARFDGVLCSDFYGAYNLYLGAHQRCWVHLLRDLQALKEEHGDQEEVVAWAEKVRALYDEAQQFLKRVPAPSAEERQRQYLTFLERLQPLGLAYAQQKKHPCQALAKRLLRHQDELFSFVLHEGLAADNNLAERSLRPLVVARKISGGTRSERGSKIATALASLFETWRARGQNSLTQCLSLLAQGP
ncbi:MAG: IS66 family transposase [Candidatus Hadarchaeum sp.]